MIQNLCSIISHETTQLSIYSFSFTMAIFYMLHELSSVLRHETTQLSIYYFSLAVTMATLFLCHGCFTSQFFWYSIYYFINPNKYTSIIQI